MLAASFVISLASLIVGIMTYRLVQQRHASVPDSKAQAPCAPQEKTKVDREDKWGNLTKAFSRDRINERS